MTTFNRMAALLAAAIAFTAAAASAQELKIGLKTEPSSLDPQYHALNPNLQIALHMFDTLVMQDENLKPKPGLALSWKPIDDTTWEFKLRPGVKFHDGSDFTAEDVVVTYERVAEGAQQPRPLHGLHPPMKSLEMVDPCTMRIHTDGRRRCCRSISRRCHRVDKAAAGAGAGGQDHGRAQRRQRPGRHRPVQARRIAARQPHRARAQRRLLGRQAALEEGHLRPLTNNAARVAALLAGDVDMIEDPPTSDIAKLKSDQDHRWRERSPTA